MNENLEVEIRQEEANDFPAVYDINLKAFKRKDEARLADRLRASDAFIPELSLVAVIGKKVVGHILFTKVNIMDDSRIIESLILAPVSVQPDLQNKGIGSRLVRHGLQKAKDLGYQSVFVLGHAHYYPRFGFLPANKWEIKLPFDVPSDAFMGVELQENSLAGVKGIVYYAREFEEL
ncbi:GNAT family N-acetyltransferase [Prevotella sp. 10(H)]|uniref:GNAT family N-acetyltransferase n=1 Tax=Prevotella sp. 10(H) TaxID=1158294 RepID=UPI0004A6AFCA|nr:N-acetyltransferase [Prevotella sp. 10(H)]